MGKLAVGPPEPGPTCVLGLAVAPGLEIAKVKADSTSQGTQLSREDQGTSVAVRQGTETSPPSSVYRRSGPKVLPC